jgi:ABC-type phosphate/phosphonate transport system substrate-binding protein
MRVLPSGLLCCMMNVFGEGARLIDTLARFWRFSISGLAFVVLLTAGCKGDVPALLATAVPLPTATPGPTAIPARPTDPPPGSSSNPLNLYLVVPGNPSGYDEQVATLGEALGEATGLAVEVEVTDDYAFVLDGLCSGGVHMGTLDAFGYLAASQQGCVTPALVTERDGQAALQGQLIANSETLITNVESFRGRRFCRPDAGSPYGWIVPGVTLRARGIDPLDELNAVVDAGSDEEVVRLVHDRECDVGATLLGAEEEVDDLEEPQRVAFVEAMAPIPNEAIVFGNAVNQELQAASLEAFEDAEDALLEVLSADALGTARDRDYNELRDLFLTAGVDVVGLAR